MSGVGQSEDGVEASTSGMMETSMMEGEEYYNPDETGTWAQKEMSDQLCRICAKHNQYLIPIFEGEGIEHQLEPKIQKHLPIEVCESDDLPLQVCYQCASTLIAWNDLVIACIEADKKLRQIHEQEQEDEDEDNKGAEFFDEPILDSDEGEDPVEPSTSIATAASDMQSDVTSHPKRSPSKAKKPKLKMTLIKSPTAGPSGLKNPLKRIASKPNEDAAQEASERYQHQKAQKPERRLPSKSPECSDSPSANTQIVKIKMENSNPVCVYCGLSFKLNLELAMHISGAHFDHVFHCDICDSIRYETKEEFTLHIQSHLTANFLDDGDNFNLMPILVEVNGRSNYKLFSDENRKIFPCHTCGRDFTRQIDLNRHSMTHQKKYAKESKKSVGQYPCDNCERIFTRRCDLSVHIEKKHQVENNSNSKHSISLNTDNNYIDLEHIENNQLTQPCLVQIPNNETNQPDMLLILPAPPWLDTQYTQGIKEEQQEEDVIENARLVVDGETVYSCTYCQQYTKSKSDFIKHLRIHSGPKAFVCDVCGKQFRAATSLKGHIRDVHARVKRFPCDLCDRRFAYLHTRDDHRRTHTGERPCVCDVCGKALRSKSSLYFHKRFHSDHRPFRCAYCDKSYRVRQQLKRHIMSHTGEKPNRCDVCGKAFRFPAGLNKHKLNHETKEQIECQICGKSFSQLRYLKIHVRSHNLRALNNLPS